MTCVLAGACAFAVCFQVKAHRPGKKLSFIALGLTAVACVVTAVFMCFLHVPSGH